MRVPARGAAPLSPRSVAAFAGAIAVCAVLGISAMRLLDALLSADAAVAAAHIAIEHVAQLRSAQVAPRGHGAAAPAAAGAGAPPQSSEAPHADARAAVAASIEELRASGLLEGASALSRLLTCSDAHATAAPGATDDNAAERPLPAAACEGVYRQAVNVLEGDRRTAETRQRETARWLHGVLTARSLAGLTVVVGVAVFVYVHGRQRQASIAQLERLAAAENHHLQRVARLAEFGQLLHSCHTPDEVYGVIEAAAADLFGGRGALYRLRASANTFDRVVAWGLAGPEQFRHDGCWAMRRGRSHSSGKGFNTPRCEHLKHLDSEVIRCVPLANQGETLGVLVLELADDGALQDDFKRVTAAAAEQVASALAGIALRERLRAQSIRDELTGLFNRRFFEESLERETRRAVRTGRPLSVVLFDVDHFKAFNDTWGHDAGDAVLRELGTLVRTLFRTEDVGCRYGGEEFVLILMDSDLAAARQRAEELRTAAMHLRVRHRDQTLSQITLSSGVACTLQHGATGASLMAAADQALYAAKRSGRNCIVTAEAAFDPAAEERRTA